MQWRGFMADSAGLLIALVVCASLGFWFSDVWIQWVAERSAAMLVMTSPSEIIEAALGLSGAAAFPWALSWTLDLGYRWMRGRAPGPLDRALLLLGAPSLGALGMWAGATWLLTALDDSASWGGVQPMLSVGSLGLGGSIVKWATFGGVVAAIAVGVRSRGKGIEPPVAPGTSGR